MLPTLTSLLLLLSATSLASDHSSKPWKPCTVRSPTTDRFFDLNPIHRAPPEEGKTPKEGEEGSWRAKGHDYGANFTLNFCGPVVEELHDVVDLDKELWRNVSAYYEKDDKVFAIGLESYEPIFRGRKLVLNYTGGSLCPDFSSKTNSKRSPIALPPRDIVQDDDDPSLPDDTDTDDEDNKDSKSDDIDGTSHERRKTTIISLQCEKDALAKTSVSFVAAVDDCVYFFEGRSPHACGGVEAETQALSPGGVFGVIFLITIAVYVAGGIIYQRHVMHQRGWRQLPNYALWSGIAGFVRDMLIVLTSSCARCLPGRRGYSRVSLGADSGRRGRRNDDENRLIDNLDEEWDD